MYNIKFNDKQISKILQHHRPSVYSSGWNYLPELNNRIDIQDGQHLGTIETFERIYDVYLVLNSGTMTSVHSYTKWGVRFEPQENESDRQEKIATGKWLLLKGVISKDEALNEFGYEGD